MKTKFRLSPGFSLTELVVTLVIGVIFFFTVGMILIYSQDSWFKSKKSADMLDDYRYTARRLNYLARQASTAGYISGTNSTEFKFQTYDRASNQLRLNKIYNDNGNLTRRSWFENTPGNEIAGSVEYETLMKNIKDFQVTVIPSGNAKITLTQTYTVTTGSTPAVIERARTFDIYRHKTDTISWTTP